MPTGQTPICHYPQGSTAKSKGGPGIFRDAAGEPIRIWVDYMLKSAMTIIQAARNEDDLQSNTSIASSHHYDPDTQLIILHPASYHIFDLYCHPDWLTARSTKRYDQYMAEHPDEEEEWTRKVLLKESWVRRCIEAGRFLGESDGWAGCRVGGPPKGQVVTVQTDVDTIMLNDSVNRELSADDMNVDMELDEGEPEVEEEDIKPTLDVPAEMVVKLEPPAPVQPVVDIRPDIIPQEAEDQDELESLFEEREPTPPPRRSSRRSRSTTRLAEIKDELESSDEEALATKRPRRRGSGLGGARSQSTAEKEEGSTAVSLIGLEDLDISMLDSGPSSRFQSPKPIAATPVVQGKIFAGLMFWVDLSLKNRGDLLKEIKTSGGKIAADHADATHVLIHKFAQQAIQWKDIISTLAPKGTWFLSPEWAKKSLAEKTRLPEINYCVPGSAIAGNSSTSKITQGTAPSQPQQANDPAAIASHSKHTGMLDNFFKRATSKHTDFTPDQVAEDMHTRYGTIPVEKWKLLFQHWTDRTALFSHLPPMSTSKPTAFAPLQESTLQVKSERTSQSSNKARLSKSELEAIFAKETWKLGKMFHNNIINLAASITAEYGSYALPSWANYYGEWKNGRGRWSEGPRMFQGVSLTPEQLSKGPVTDASISVDPAPIPTSTPHSQSDVAGLSEQSTRVSVSDMASAFTRFYKHDGDQITINALLGEHMQALYPAYTAQKWEKMARKWKQGSGKFAEFGPRWDGDLAAIENPFVNEEPENRVSAPVVPAGSVLRYTEDEELAMGQFVIHQESNGEPIAWASWSIFAEVYPHRKKGAWAEHYRLYKDRIMDITKRHEATLAGSEANRPDDVDMDPTYSDRSESPIASGSQSKPKKQKVAVSKKDYEDLARFIVDNIAEGDVPDSKDFAAFSKDRSAKSWYTIWHRDKYRSTLLPLVDELRRAATPARSQSIQVRAASSTRPRPNAYTDEEEREMADFIVRQVPSDRLPKVADWNKFQRNHTKRTAASWMEHYRVYKPRIDGLIAEIKAAQPSIAMLPKGTAQDAIELGSEEEEEEEVEDIVPIYPRNGRRSDVIIIED